MRVESADEFFESLLNKVQALSEALDHEPASTEIIVAELKHYLAEPSHRIRLHDLVIRETQRLIESLQGPEWFTSSHGAEHIITTMVRYESVSQRFLSLTATLAFFSDSAEQLRTLSSAVSMLARRERKVAGIAALIDLQQYTALMTLYVVGIAELAADELRAFWTVAALPVSATQGTIPLHIGASTLQSMPDPGVLKSIPGLEKHYTPASDHLHSVVREPLRNLIPEDREYDDLFDQLEYLLGLMYAGFRGDGMGPVGRFSWKLVSLPDATALRYEERMLEDGLFKSVEQFSAVKEAFDALAARARFGLS